MTVVGLHPEELFDKLLEGEITSLERDRLRSHLDACEVCRFEYAARVDFQEEALSLGSLGAPPALPLRAPQPLAAAPARVRSRRRGSRLLIWGVAAAALITASGAVASVFTGTAPWRAVSVMFAQTKSAPGPVEPTLKRATRATSSCAGPDCSAKLPVAVVVAPAREPLAAPAFAQPDASPRAAPRAAALPASPREVAGERDVSVKAAPAAAEKEAAAKAPVKEVAPAAKLFGEANQARRSGDIGRASGLYQLLQEQYPGSPEAELSRVTLALLLLDSGDAQGALKGFERYLAGGARGLEAEALVGRARALGRLGRRDLEAAAWREVQRKFPRSIYGRQATERLAALGRP